ncbi:carbohydrate kinase [Faecalicatena contorta]|uniref:Carbohydrate kinase n=1 Tax=Faecalicatena fissicatena TaxID=290055 RepID=A0ABS2ECS0_9FIRM|nr:MULTISPECIES: FGGY-family carbohydrate kinase [Faecalicatena]MBM6684882.1 carbohydrate kinase [Faecalicatena contorta]MBM6710410.1 carbohydrate kinase [Faecalicatena contorta]MBM6739352.1 carbohydrate kinase [Faecalicatena fissicatena]
MYIISLDIGTSGMRAVIYGTNGKKYENAYYEYHSDFPQPGYVEQDPQTWKDAAVYCLSNVAGYLKEDPLAITVTSQRSSLIPMKDGEPMRTAIMWQDKRTMPQCEKLIQEYTLEGLYRKTGLRTNPYFVLPKILWLKENQPDIYETAEKFIGVQDLVIHFLTGEYKTDYSQACRTLLMNIETFSWDPELLAIGGITEERLPDLMPPGSIAGGLTKEMAQKLGLKEGLPVIMAGGDQQNAAIALGVNKPGRAEANTGTGSFVISAVDKPVFDEHARVLCQASAIAGQWIMEAGIFNTGAIYRWFKEQFCQDMQTEGSVYNLMNEEAVKSGMGANGVIMIPHFEGSAAPYWNPYAKGLFFNLSLNTKRGDLIRAIMEGIAVEINADISLIEEITQPIYRVSVAGGMVNADVFCEIQANIYNKEVARYTNNEASSLGAAMIAAVTLGVYPDIEEAFLNMMEDIPHTFYPDPAEVEKGEKIIQRKYKLYNSLEKEHVYEDFVD